MLQKNAAQGFVFCMQHWVEVILTSEKSNKFSVVSTSSVSRSLEVEEESEKIKKIKIKKKD
jgi:hypothetical protein